MRSEVASVVKRLRAIAAASLVERTRHEKPSELFKPEPIPEASVEIDDVIPADEIILSVVNGVGSSIRFDSKERTWMLLQGAECTPLSFLGARYADPDKAPAGPAWVVGREAATFELSIPLSPTVLVEPPRPVGAMYRWFREAQRRNGR
jgi:hypothetical protein